MIFAPYAPVCSPDTRMSHLVFSIASPIDVEPVVAFTFVGQ